MVAKVSKIVEREAAGAGAVSATPVLTPKFIIGVFKQPVSLFSAWKARGVNTLFFWEPELNAAKQPTKSQKDWRAAAANAGLFYIDQPLGGTDVPQLVTPAPSEVSEPWLLAFGQPDEMDRQGISGQLALQRYQAWSAGGKPVYGNLDGHQFDNVAYDGTPHPARPLNDPQHWGHRAASAGYMAAFSFGGFDYYLKPERPGMWFITERLLDRYQEWSGNKPMVIVLPLSFTDKGYSWVDVRQTLLHDITYCARIGLPVKGLMLYPQRQNPFRYDDESPETAASLPVMLREMLGVGQGTVVDPPIDPGPVVPTPPVVPVKPAPTLESLDNRITTIENKLNL